MVRTKVFVGNLSFTTKENELAKEFEVAGKVISANIITRGPRSLGYGFVEMDNETDAENAVKLLDKKEIDGRPINVEVAKPREEGTNNDAHAANAQGNARGSRPRGRGGRRPTGMTRPAQGQSQGSAQGQNQTQGQSQDANRRQPRRRVSEEGERPKRIPKPRQRREEGEPDTRVPSTTTLFVANLPFVVDDDAFSKLLKDNSLAFKSAHVVQKRTGRSKGFGFIEFENEADQQKALTALNDKPVEGRQLAVKVALTETVKSEDNNNTAKATTSTSSPAPVKTTTSTSSPAPVKTTTSTSSPAPAKTTTSTSTPTKTSSPSPAKATDKKDEKPVTPKQEKK